MILIFQKWKKTVKDGKGSKSEVVKIGYNFTDISIVYYYDSSTLEITFKNSGYDCLFKEKKYPNNIYFSLKLPLII